MKTLHKNIQVTLVVIASFLLTGVIITFAAAPSGGYTPGATLDPDCAPGDADCIVAAISATNGLNSPSSGVVELGGALTENTVIDIEDFTFQLGDISTGDRRLVFDDNLLGPGNGASAFLYTDTVTGDVSLNGAFTSFLQGGIDVVGSIALTNPAGSGPFPAAYSTVDESNVTTRSINAAGDIYSDVIVNASAPAAAMTVTNTSTSTTASSIVSEESVLNYVTFASGNQATFSADDEGVQGESARLAYENTATSKIDFLKVSEDSILLNINNDSNPLVFPDVSAEIEDDEFSINFANAGNTGFAASLTLQETGDFQIIGPGAGGQDFNITVDDTSGLVMVNNTETVALDEGVVTASTLISLGNTNLVADLDGNIILDPSDAKLKTDVEPLESALDKVLRLNPISYGWKDTDRFGTKREIGFLAQEVQEIIPEVVSQGPEYLSVSYGDLTALNAAAIQELAAEVEGLTLLEDFDNGKRRSLANYIKDVIADAKEWVVDTLTARKVVTTEFCIDDVCIDRNTLESLVDGLGDSPAQEASDNGSEEEDEDPVETGEDEEVTNEDEEVTNEDVEIVIEEEEETEPASDEEVVENEEDPVVDETPAEEIEEEVEVEEEPEAEETPDEEV